MGVLTRFYDRISGQDGPVSGALVVIPVSIPSVTNTSTVQQVNLPAGMAFEITDIMFSAQAITATPKIEIGTASSGEEIVASVSATTNLGALTIVEGTVPAAGDIFVTIVATASDVLTGGDLTIVGHVAAPPTSVDVRP